MRLRHGNGLHAVASLVIAAAWVQQTDPKAGNKREGLPANEERPPMRKQAIRRWRAEGGFRAPGRACLPASSQVLADLHGARHSPSWGRTWQDRQGAPNPDLLRRQFRHPLLTDASGTERQIAVAVNH